MNHTKKDPAKVGNLIGSLYIDEKPPFGYHPKGGLL